ncbi:MAG: capsular biosynthesis protein [Cyclobacteriaceae bacterium]|nr:capsular biosynthesis protein [Cyclobacteriaceae bacterium]
MSPLRTDFHSHLLPALDDGVATTDAALAVIQQLATLGYTRLITTPHIMHDTYPNTVQTITRAWENLNKVLVEAGIPVTLEIAAEYYLDEQVFAMAENGTKFMTFGDKHFLFETNFYSEPFQLSDFIFKSFVNGYKPILAHPERYGYITLAKVEEFRHRGVLMQLNLLSLCGYYGKPIQKLAQKMVVQGWVDAVGSDCHNLEQAHLLTTLPADKYYQKALALPLLNYKL